MFFCIGPPPSFRYIVCDIIMTMNIDKQLLALGLHETEVKIYTVLLASSVLTVGQISTKVEVSRGNVYYMLEKLQERGLVEPVQVGKKTKYQAAHPHKLNDYLDSQERNIQQSRLNISAVMDEMIRGYNVQHNTPGVYVFDGIDGLKKVYNELLEDNLPMLSIEDTDNLNSFMPEFFDNFMRQTLKQKHKNRAIGPDTNEYYYPGEEKVWEYREIDVKKFPFAMDVTVTEKKVVLVTFQNDTVSGVVIIQPEIIRNFQIWFEFMWNVATPMPKGTY